MERFWGQRAQIGHLFSHSFRGQWFYGVVNRLKGFVLALVSIALVTLAIGLIRSVIWIPNLSFLYLVAVLALASSTGSGPAILASFIAFLAYDFFFVGPVRSITITRPEEWLALLIFLMTALITGQLAARLRQQAEEARTRERDTAFLLQIATALHGTDFHGSLQAVAEHLRLRFGVESVAIIIDRAGFPTVRVVAGEPVPETILSMSEGLAFVLQDQGGDSSHWIRVSGPALAPAKARTWVRCMVPIRSRDRRCGSLILLARTEPRFQPHDNRLLLAVAAQVGLTVEREALRREAIEAEVFRRMDELKTTLLNAVSHDLRTPLATIIAAAESLLQEGIEWSPEERRELLETLLSEAHRLERLVTNLLDLSRLEAGKLQLDLRPHPVSDLIHAALDHAQWRLQQHRLVVDLPEDLPPVLADSVKIEQVLVNLLENAAKYSPPGSTIRIAARQQGESVAIAVEDEGPGIPRYLLPSLFAPFARLEQGPGDGPRPPGTGLGLAIARALVLAHGGRIDAENRPSGGARFIITLPIATPPRRTVEDSEHPWTLARES